MNPGFCLFCYKTITISTRTGKNQESVNKFVKTLNRLTRHPELNIFRETVVTKKLLESCSKCNSAIKDICEIYNQLNILQFKLDFKLDNLAEKINYANKVPTRWIHVNSVLEETFPNDLEKKTESQNKIRKFRQSIIEAGKYFSTSFLLMY